MTYMKSLKAGALGALLGLDPDAGGLRLSGQHDHRWPDQLAGRTLRILQAHAAGMPGQPSSGAPGVLTRDGWKKMLEINYDTNQAVTPMTDKDIYGVEEYWAYLDKVGDCEDYVLLKRRKLIDAGFSPSDLLITVVLQPNGDGHAVLTVRTDRGDVFSTTCATRCCCGRIPNTLSSSASRKRIPAAGWLQDGRAVAVGSVSQ